MPPIDMPLMNSIEQVSAPDEKSSHGKKKLKLVSSPILLVCYAPWAGIYFRGRGPAKIFAAFGRNSASDKNTSAPLKFFFFPE